MCDAGGELRRAVPMQDVQRALELLQRDQELEQKVDVWKYRQHFRALKIYVHCWRRDSTEVSVRAYGPSCPGSILGILF